MTREEAIQALNEIFDDSEFSRYEAWYGTAMTMAIEALSEPKWNCTANFTAEQLERLRNMTDEERWAFFIKYFSTSAEPSIVRCKDCRYFKKITERSDSGLCHRDIVASVWIENGYCSRGERREPSK